MARRKLEEALIRRVAAKMPEEDLEALDQVIRRMSARSTFAEKD